MNLALLMLAAYDGTAVSAWADLMRHRVAPGRPKSVREALVERATMVGIASLRQLCSLHRCDAQSRRRVQSVWTALCRTATASRRASRTTMQLPRVPLASVRAALDAVAPIAICSAAPRRSGSHSQASTAVGGLTCAFVEPTPPVLPAWPAGWDESSNGSRIGVWRPSLKPAAQAALQQLLPTRSSDPRQRVDPQQALAMVKAQAWQLGRHIQPGHWAVFQPRTANRRINAAAVSQHRARGSGAITASVARRFLSTTEVPTLMATSGGHCWTVSSACAPAPADLGQYAAISGVPSLLPHLQRAVATNAVTEAQMRALLGQGVHGSATRHVGARLLRRLPAAWLRRPWKLASLCCGIDTLAWELLPLLPAGSHCAWAVDACKIAQRGHRALWMHSAHPPQLLDVRAEAAELRCAKWHVHGELLTPRCAPFSAANRRFPKGCWAALRELEEIVAGTAVRKPRVVIYENTAGLWRTPVLRACVEEILLRILSAYDWEATLVSPHLHCGVPVRRSRVFYVGVLRAAA